MTLKDLIIKFILIKKTKPKNVNELLDFIQRDYINNEITINEYKALYAELTLRGAEKPTSFLRSLEPVI